MITVRRAQDRGFADHGWLKSHHTFSFADYQDPQHMGFRSLRVINEDVVAAGKGFGTHAHQNMEIVSYVLSGELEHKDSMGNGEVLKPGEFQRITAGTGITHSEFNPSTENPTHFYQIWLFPESSDLKPSYEQKAFDVAERMNRFQLVASRNDTSGDDTSRDDTSGDDTSRDGTDGSLLIHQDARIYLANLSSGHQINHPLAEQRNYWLQVLRGALAVNDSLLEAGDAAAISEESKVFFQAREDTEIMLFDLA